jgi:hypothetical protein
MVATGHSHLGSRFCPAAYVVSAVHQLFPLKFAARTGS